MALILTGTSSSTTLDSSAGLTFSDSSNQSAAASPYGLKNRIINGDMVIDQRNAGASFAGGGYSLDRWLSGLSTNAWTSQRSTNAPAGFVNSLLVTVTTPQAPGATNLAYYSQKIEGFNIADLNFGTANAATVTLSFWVRSSVTGTFSIALLNGSQNRSYVATYTINAANTWEKETITITGDTAGTWNTNNTAGLEVFFDLGSGSNFQATAGSWQAGTFLRTSGSSNFANTSGATFYITGVQLERNTTATPFEWLPYGMELMLCQRYYAKLTSASGNFVGHGSGYVVSSTSSNAWIKYPTTMRAAPTLAVSGLAITDGNANYSITSFGSIYYGYDGLLATFVNSSGATAFRPILVIANNNTTGYVEIAAEL